MYITTDSAMLAPCHCGTWNCSEEEPRQRPQSAASENRKLAQITGIRSLRKKKKLMNEGKITSLVVIYLQEQSRSGAQAGSKPTRVRLGGKWLKYDQYEWDKTPRLVK
ncbi:hypothetical protein BDZ91DRAFT_768797 [Kalaharituber pfeilii]|nr:hypothetical protein BDZ91DRAFT_768797 [Kalaharituber pfeilii]